MLSQERNCSINRITAVRLEVEENQWLTLREIEVVVALLPEVISRADQSSRDTLFERLDRVCEPVALRFADEQVDVLGHPPG